MKELQTKHTPQWQQVLTHLMLEQTITQRQADTRYGIARIAARVDDLHKMGFPVKARDIKVKNRHGKMVTVAEYYLEPNRELV